MSARIWWLANDIDPAHRQLPRQFVDSNPASVSFFESACLGVANGRDQSPKTRDECRRLLRSTRYGTRLSLEGLISDSKRFQTDRLERDTDGEGGRCCCTVLRETSKSVLV